MTPRSPKETLAAFRWSSCSVRLTTLAYLSSLEAGITNLIPTTYSWTALPLSNSELPWLPVPSIPPRVAPNQLGEWGKAKSSSAAAWISYLGQFCYFLRCSLITQDNCILHQVVIFLARCFNHSEVNFLFPKMISLVVGKIEVLVVNLEVLGTF